MFGRLVTRFKTNITEANMEWNITKLEAKSQVLQGIFTFFQNVSNLNI